MRSPRAGLARLAVAVGMLVLLSACGPGASDDTSEGRPTATSAVPTTATPTTPRPTVTTPPPDATPAGTTSVPDDLRPALAEAADDEAEIYGNGCHRDRETTAPAGCVTGKGGTPRVVLFGDSHAAQWYPAFARLAEQGVITLDSRTKSSCPSVEAKAVIPDDGAGQPYPACEQWRHRVVDELVDDPPAVVVLANFSRSYNRDDPDQAVRWTRAIRTTVRALSGASRVVVVADTPRLGTSPAPCLQRHPDDTAPCEKTRSAMLDTTTRRAEQRALAGAAATYVDFTDTLCNARSCPTIIGRTLVYRDRHHLTATMSAHLAGRWRQALVRAGAPID